MAKQLTCKLIMCLGLLLGLSTGCGDEGGSAASPDAGAAIDGGSDATSSPAAQPTPSTPLVVVTERESPEDRVQYLHVLADWPASRQLDVQKSVELGADVVVRAGDGAVWSYQPEDATMQKYLVDPQLGITPGPKISFAAHGVSGSAPDTVWVSPERAFLVDETSGQIILWNPTAMQIGPVTQISPSLLTKDGFDVQLQSNAVVVGNRAFMTAAYRDWETFRYLDGATIAWFDVTLDAPTLQFITEDRCASSVAAPYVDRDGSVYVVGDAALGFDALASSIKTAKPQCVRRLLPGTVEFDPDFFVDVQAATGSPGFYAAHGMAGGKLLVNQWAPSIPVAAVANPASSDWYWDYPPHFEHVILDLTSKQVTPVSALQRAAVQWSSTLRLDGQNYVQSYRPTDQGVNLSRVATDGSVSTVLDLGADSDVQYIGRL